MTEGEPWLQLFDEKGNPRLALAVTEAGPGLGLFDEKRQAGVVLGLGEYGPGPTVLDEKGKNRAVLGHTKLTTIKDGTLPLTPESSLVLFDKEGNMTWRAP